MNLAVLALLGVASAQEVSASGLAEVRSAFSVGAEGTVWQLVERLRPTIEARISRHVLISATAEARLSQGRRLSSELRRTVEESSLGPLVDVLCDWPEVDHPALGIDQTSDWLTLDRLFVDVYTGAGDVRVGRQALQWGSGLLINPTDPLPQILFTEPWRPRAGVNAVRASLPIAELHQVQVVLSADDRFRAVRAAARGTVAVGGFDLSLVGAYRQDADNGIVGIDLKGTAGVGLWLEGAVHLGRGGYGQGIYEELVVGLDYSVPVLQTLYLAAQYVRIGREPPPGGALPLARVAPDDLGLPDCEGVDLASALGGPAPATTDPFASALSGNDYLMLVARLGIVPELSLDVAALQNLGDGTGIAIPTLTARPTGWLDLSLSAQVPFRLWGRGGEFKPGADALVLTPPEDSPLQASVDLSGLVPDATITLWTRANF